jgi:hypothetical protein
VRLTTTNESRCATDTYVVAGSSLTSEIGRIGPSTEPCCLIHPFAANVRRSRI